MYKINTHNVSGVRNYVNNPDWRVTMTNYVCMYVVGVTLIFEGNPKIIVQRWQIAAPRWSNDISSAADNVIFSRPVEIKCCQYPLQYPIRSTWSDNDRHYLLRPLLAQFRRKFDQLSLWTIIRTKQWLVLGASTFQCMLAGFLCTKCDNGKVNSLMNVLKVINILLLEISINVNIIVYIRYNCLCILFTFILVVLFVDFCLLFFSWYLLL